MGAQTADAAEVEEIDSLSDVDFSTAIEQSELGGENPLEEEEDLVLAAQEEPPVKVAAPPIAPAAKPSAPAPTKSAQPEQDGDRLKTEIKTVLSYLDKLLDSLPEEKIEEFARSKYFDTYKKLFEELGLV